MTPLTSYDIDIRRHHHRARFALSRPGKLSSIAATLGMLLTTMMDVVVADPIQAEAFFAEPISGRRVTEYVVDLPVDRTQRRTFTIPSDCDGVMSSVEQGATYKGTIIDRRLWQKVEADCRYHSFLHQHPQQVIEDYVSDYDFMNAKLSDLPIDLGCAGGEAGKLQTECNPSATDGFGLLHHFPLAEPFLGLSGQHREGECSLQNGLFYGHMYVDVEGIRCDADARAPSLRLIAVDFADVNGDHVLDAVLRFVPIGPGAGRSPLILPLTRKQATGPFHVPVNPIGLPPSDP